MTIFNCKHEQRWQNKNHIEKHFQWKAKPSHLVNTVLGRPA